MLNLYFDGRLAILVMSTETQQNQLFSASEVHYEILPARNFLDLQIVINGQYFSKLNVEIKLYCCSMSLSHQLYLIKKEAVWVRYKI